MKHTLLLAVISIGLLSSCSTAFKAGQTPDDVYYSPGREIASAKEEEVQKKENEQYQEYVSSMDDRYLRMKVANRYRWGMIDNYDYWYDSRYDFSSSYYKSYNNYSTWNPCWNTGFGYGNRGFYGNIGWNNPYYTVISYTTPTKQTGGGYTAGSNITAYKNKTYNNSNYGYKDLKTGAFVPSSNNNSFGNLLKRVFTGSADNNTATSFDRPVRTYTSTPTTSSSPAPATSSSAGGSSGGYQSTGTSTSTGRGGRGG